MDDDALASGHSRFNIAHHADIFDACKGAGDQALPAIHAQGWVDDVLRTESVDGNRSCGAGLNAVVAALASAVNGDYAVG